MDENFANYPVSVTEMRSNQDGDGAKWKPRDALIYLLRRIDAGEVTLNSLVIAYGEKVDANETKCRCLCAAPDVCTTLGLLSYAQISLAT